LLTSTPVLAYQYKSSQILTQARLEGASTFFKKGQKKKGSGALVADRQPHALMHSNVLVLLVPKKEY
jgi:hypothetical protein